MAEPGDSTDSCTLRIAVVGGPQYDRLYERLELFEQETGCRVQIVFRGSHPELNDYLASTFQCYDPKLLGSSLFPVAPPELDLISTHIKYAPSQTHFLQELDNHISEQEQGEFLDAALQASRVHGKLVQLPRMVDSRVLFYRADVLEAIGVSPPETWQDVLSIAIAVHKAAIPVESLSSTSDSTLDLMHGYVFPGKLSGLFGTFYELAMMEMQDTETLFDRENRPVFEESVVVRVLKYMRELVSTHAVPQDIHKHYFDQVSSLFSEGQVAMVADWPSFYGEMKQKLKTLQPMARIKVMRYPIGANGRRSAYSGMHSFAIPKSCRYPKQALQLLKFLVRDDQQWIEASKSGSFPTKKAVLQRLEQGIESKRMSGDDSTGQQHPDVQLDSERLACLQATVENDMAMFPHLRSYPELEDALYVMIQDAMMGHLSPEEAAQRMRAVAQEFA
ncbi:hypothetical protein B0O80DRAFT_455072 [Mortierella sp. GBAus27b]|nr:hypothetical protein BGX31_002496 [Mortierella sp. GBA43]KAI8351944.1 hypothetical protein B0O80DRAFT_455072 [Mortierella sp. GBAus27b]